MMLHYRCGDFAMQTRDIMYRHPIKHYKIWGDIVDHHTKTVFGKPVADKQQVFTFDPELVTILTSWGSPKET